MTVPNAVQSPHRGLPHLDEDRVAAAVPMEAALAALRHAFVAAHEGRALPIAKTMVQWQEQGSDGAVSSAHALGAVDVGTGRVAFKYWVNTPIGAQALVTLFDATAGRALTTLDAGQLGMLRTSGTAGLATAALAVPEADRMALIGAGRQAVHQVRAVSAVRDLKEVRIWSRDPARAAACAHRVQTELGLTAAVRPSAEDAVRDVPIVTTVTRARDPFLDVKMLADGAHLNAVGAVLPTHRELMPGVVEAAALVVVDDRENARRAAAELREAQVDLDGVMTLGHLVAENVTRPAAARLTLFKAVGTGIGDLAIAAAAHRQTLGA